MFDEQFVSRLADRIEALLWEDRALPEPLVFEGYRMTTPWRPFFFNVLEAAAAMRGTRRARDWRPTVAPHLRLTNSAFEAEMVDHLEAGRILTAVERETATVGDLVQLRSHGWTRCAELAESGADGMTLPAAAGHWFWRTALALLALRQALGPGRLLRSAPVLKGDEEVMDIFNPGPGRRVLSADREDGMLVCAVQGGHSLHSFLDEATVVVRGAGMVPLEVLHAGA